MLKAVRTPIAVPFLLLAALRPLSAQTVDQLLNQSPEKLAALKNDPHIAKRDETSSTPPDSGADVLKKADGVLGCRGHVRAA